MQDKILHRLIRLRRRVMQPHADNQHRTTLSVDAPRVGFARAVLRSEGVAVNVLIVQGRWRREKVGAVTVVDEGCV